ncbi:MAG: glutamate ligase domain-containing protein, partial [Ostreibacterium sp.]
IHNVMNALGCAASALALGVDLSTIAAGLSQFKMAKGRLQKYSYGNITVIDDTYNANPMSMRASAEILSGFPGHRVMVIGELGELGDDEVALHAQLGRDLLGKAEQFFCLGDKMLHFAEHNAKAVHHHTISSLNQALLADLSCLTERQKVTILVKGSRAMQMEYVVDKLLQHLGQE